MNVLSSYPTILLIYKNCRLFIMLETFLLLEMDLKGSCPSFADVRQMESQVRSSHLCR